MLRSNKARRNRYIHNAPCPRTAAPKWALPGLDPPIFTKTKTPDENLSLNDIRTCGSLIRHIAYIDRVPDWARPRFAAKMGLDQLSAQAQAKWTHRFLEDRKALLVNKLESMVPKLLNFDANNKCSDSNEFARRAFEEIIIGNPNPPPQFDIFIDTCIKKFVNRSLHTANKPKVLEQILTRAAHDFRDKAPEERILRTIQLAEQQEIASAHPALRCILEAFQRELNSNATTIPTDPLHSLLLKGEGFIPTPNSFTSITNTLVHSVRNTSLLSFMPGHPGIDSIASQLYQQRMADICRGMQWKDNLSRPERQALNEAKKDKHNVFVPTDKTGKLLRIPKSTMTAVIEKFILDKQGSTFDIITDSITMGTLLTKQKREMTDSIPFFNLELEKWHHHLHMNIANGANIPTAANTPSVVHDKHFPRGTTAIDKILKILISEAKYLPSFGPLKPHIKDHKLATDIQTILDEAERTGTIPTLPLRMTHKATCGPTAALAEIIGPVLEALANCCQLSLSQASCDIAKFCAAYDFALNIEFGAIDVTDAFWQMSQNICLERVRKLFRRYPQTEAIFGITEEALIKTIKLIWNDNFFSALGTKGPIYGKINGCTMGNVISMALCRIYYFSSLEEAINLVGPSRFVYAKSGGDDALIIAWDKTSIEKLMRTLNELPDNWNYEFRAPDANHSLSFFDCQITRTHNPANNTWLLQTGVHFKPTDMLNRTDASSHWSWDHQEALLRSHLHRAAILCSNIEQTREALNKIGQMLAKRHHPRENIITSFERLNTSFLIESMSERTTVSPDNCPAVSTFGPWTFNEPPPTLSLSGTVPFLSGNRNEQAKRTTGTFLQQIATAINLKIQADITISVNNTPFKNLSRILPIAKCPPPTLLECHAVYKIQNPLKDNVCGVGQVGIRPVAHRMNEHTWDMQGRRGPYDGTGCQPFNDLAIVTKESNKFMRLAWEAIHIFTSQGCVTQASIDISMWNPLLAQFTKNIRGVAGGTKKPAAPPPSHLTAAGAETRHHTNIPPPPPAPPSRLSSSPPPSQYRPTISPTTLRSK